MTNDKAALRRVLLYYVVKGNFTAARVVKLRSTMTLAGPSVAICRVLHDRTGLRDLKYPAHVTAQVP